MIFVVLIFTVNVVLGKSTEPPKLVAITSTSSHFNIDSYKEKICKSEPTCNLIDSTPKGLIPKELTTLEHRNCMCDADCVTYGDCCSDSKYYKEAEQKRNFHNYHCSLQERVYMKTKCPSNYKDVELKDNCEKSVLPLESEDKKLIIPVTNIKTRTTYGNEYCARCHGEKDYQPWNLTSYCSAAITEFIVRDDFKQNYPLANLENDTAPMMIKLPTYRAENLADLTENSTLPAALNDLLSDSEEAVKHIKFDPSSKTFYSVYKEKNFTCSYGRIAPSSLESYLRTCEVIVGECPNSAGKSLADKCSSYTSIVFDNYGAYRNKDCAACNGITENLPGCFNEQPAFSPASSLFSTNNKGNGANPCASPGSKFC